MVGISAELGARERRIVIALADVAVPSGRRMPAASDATVRALADVLAMLGPPASDAYPVLLRALDALTAARTGRTFEALTQEERKAQLESLESHAVSGFALNALLTPLRVARARELVRSDVACTQKRLPMAREHARWMERVVDAADFAHGEQLEADVVVVGTGAGGGAVAKALAVRGHAVLLLEEGGLYTRADFQGDLLERQRKLYRPMTVALGNTMIPVPTGRSVGGTTTINSGTCFRPPSEVLRRWRFEHGLVELDERTLEPYFERVEAMLEVGPTPAALTSASERMVARGADALGWPHAPLWRNAPGCDGQSECCFGCPTDAKRSTNVSYVPAALSAGAMLVCHAKVERILHEHGRAIGVTAHSVRPDGSHVRITVRAKAVVLACGTFETPALLLRNALCNRSGELGKHLTLHPASHAWARFDHALEGPSGVPQGHCVEVLAEQGVRLEGGFPPKELSVTTLMQWGDELTDMLERFEELAFCGFMIRDDHSRGRVTLDGSGKPRVTYWLDDRDRHKLVLGHAALARVFLAAGASTVFPGIFAKAYTRIQSTERARDLEQHGAALNARDFALTAFHPLGTCRMGTDPARYVVGPSHETHDLEALFVCDGSVVPGPLGVNPQVTIMALAERASEHVERRIEGRAFARRPDLVGRAANDNQPHAPSRLAPSAQPVRLVAKPGHALAFAEIMRGMCHPLIGPRRSRLVQIDVRAAGNLDTLLRDLSREGSTFELTGKIHVDGLADDAPCHGTLKMVPRELARALVYELSFTDDAGTACSLYGEKRLHRGNPVRGMTTLYTEVGRGEPRVPLLRGVLHFELSQLVPWLRSFRRL